LLKQQLCQIFKKDNGRADCHTMTAPFLHRSVVITYSLGNMHGIRGALLHACLLVSSSVSQARVCQLHDGEAMKSFNTMAQANTQANSPP